MEWTASVEREINPLVLSPSKVSKLSECGYRVYLDSVMRQPRTGAWWFVGGRAFAAFKQRFEEEATSDGHDAAPWPTAGWARSAFIHEFVTEIERARETDGPVEEWKAANHSTEDGEWWATHGQRMAELYVERNPPDRGFSTLLMPDGSLALEVGFTVVLGDRLMTGRADHLTVDRSGYVDVQDDKTGKSWPADSFQLEAYAVAFEDLLGLSIARLHYYLARELPKATKVSRKNFLITKSWVPERRAQVVARVEATAQVIEKRAYLPVVTHLCKSCDQRTNCAYGGTSKEVI